MKKILATIMTMTSLFCCSCFNVPKEELSTLEKEIVGEWIFKGASIRESIGSYSFYPNGPTDFQAIVYDYYDKATLVFYEEKFNGQIKGELRTSGGTTTFFWTRPTEGFIELEYSISMRYSPGVGEKIGYTDFMTISNDLSYILVGFEAAKVVY